jgi:prepilin-type N-terminal cleavage/methylation domain-containing protein
MLLRPITQTGRATIRGGFTLLELLVVVAILVVLVGVATPMYLNYLEQSKARIAKIEAKSLAGEITRYAISHDGNFPQEGDWSLLPLPPEKKPMPLDPWRHPYQWALRPIMQADGTQHMDPVVWSGGPLGNQGAEGEYSSMSP